MHAHVCLSPMRRQAGARAHPADGSCLLQGAQYSVAIVPQRLKDPAHLLPVHLLPDVAKCVCQDRRESLSMLDFPKCTAGSVDFDVKWTKQ